MESQLSELTNWVLLTCCDNEILWLLSLENQPHALYIIFGITPVAEWIQVTQIELALLTLLDACRSQCNLTGNECLTTALTLVIEEDTRAAEHVVCLAILLDNPETILLGNSVWRIRVEWSVLVLRNLFYLTVELRCWSLIHAAGLLQTALADSLQDAEHTGSIYICCKLRGVEAHLYVALCCQIIYLSRFHLVHYLDDTHRVTEVSIVKMEIRCTLQMGNSFAVVGRWSADSSVNIIPFFQQ